MVTSQVVTGAHERQAVHWLQKIYILSSKTCFPKKYSFTILKPFFQVVAAALQQQAVRGRSRDEQPDEQCCHRVHPCQPL